MAVTAQQVREYRRVILDYLSTGTEEILRSSRYYDYAECVKKYDKNGFWFCENDNSIQYFGQLVADKNGVILTCGDWELEFEKIYTEAMALLEKDSLEFHWMFYGRNKKRPEDDEAAWGIIRTEMEKRRLQRMPGLHAKDSNGELLSVEEIMRYAKDILRKFGKVVTERDVIYGGQEVVETFCERKPLRVVSKTDQHIRICYYNVVVFECIYLYDDICDNASSWYKRLTRNDYFPFVKVFQGGQWEQMLKELANEK